MSSVTPPTTNQPTNKTTATDNNNTITAKQYKTKEGHLVFSSVLTLPDGTIWYETRPGDSFVVTKEVFDNILNARQLKADQLEDVTISKPHALLTLEQQSQQSQQEQQAGSQQPQPQATT